MMGRISFLHQPASYVRQMLTVMISDRGLYAYSAKYCVQCKIVTTEWLQKTYFPTCLKRLRELLEMTIDWLNKNGIPFIRPTGGLFIYANFNKVKLSLVFFSLELQIFTPVVSQ